MSHMRLSVLVVFFFVCEVVGVVVLFLLLLLLFIGVRPRVQELVHSDFDWATIVCPSTVEPLHDEG